MQTLRNYDAKALWQADLDHCVHPWTDFSDWPRTGSTIMVRGEGACVWNAEGEKFIDGIGGLWFANVGFDRQELIDAATRQLGMLPQFSYFTDIGNLNVLSPALTLSRDEIDRIVSILRDAIEDTMAELDREGLKFAA